MRWLRAEKWPDFVEDESSCDCASDGSHEVVMMGTGGDGYMRNVRVHSRDHASTRDSDFSMQTSK